jgi:hypothetical protein
VADQVVCFDPTQDPGERLAPEVRQEIAEVAPSAVVNGSITTAKLAQDAVTTDKLDDGAVTSPKIAQGGVAAINLGPESVTTAKIADNGVTPEKCGTGVVTAADASNNAVETIISFVTAAEYAALMSPDPNTTYFIA